jgi:O-antigen ligase
VIHPALRVVPQGLAAPLARPQERPDERPDERPGEADWPQRLASFVLPACLAVVYSGAERYFYAISHVLQFGFDGVVVASALVCAWSSRRSRLAMLAVVPYAVWITGFHVWGLLVSPAQARVLSTAVSVTALNLLLLTATAVAVAGGRGVSRLADFIQCAVLVNLGMSLWEAGHPQVTVQLAGLVHSDYYNPLRPSGLWIQPNVAAIGFLFALVISRLSTRPGSPWIWLARIGSIVGIYLSGSRSGLYPLVLCLVVIAAAEARRSRLGAGSWAAVLLALFAAAGLALTLTLASPASGLARGYDAVRFLDFAQQLRTPTDPSRSTVTGIWLQRAINGPWQGSGLYSFRGFSRAVQGPHDVFIAVWGETGPLGLVSYVGVIAAAVVSMLRTRLPSRTRTTVACLWLVYLMEAFVEHNQLSSVMEIVIVGLLFSLPAVLGQSQERSA